MRSNCVLPSPDFPDNLSAAVIERARPRIEALAERAVEAGDDGTATELIKLLDTVDGDADHEPDLSAQETDRGISQEAWAELDTHDREGPDPDPEPDDPAEPDLGAPESDLNVANNRSGNVEQTMAWCHVTDHEEEDEAEPDLGWRNPWGETPLSYGHPDRTPPTAVYDTDADGEMAGAGAGGAP